MAMEPAADLLAVVDEEHLTPGAWAEARDALAAAHWYWLATERPDGGPHLVPLLGVWLDDVLHIAASPASRKARNLAQDPRCSIGTREHGIDLVVEGRAVQVTDADRLQRVAEAYAAKYGWEVAVRDGALFGEGAPTAGPPPYAVHAVAPTTAFGFPAGEKFPPTRWRFTRGR